MKYQKSIFLLPIILFVLSLNIMTIHPFQTLETSEPVDQLNELMKSTLELKSNQITKVEYLTNEYLKSRNELLVSTNKIGKNTALLVSWDQWRNDLSQNLSASQMEKFMNWQAKIDLLAVTPF